MQNKFIDGWTHALGHRGFDYSKITDEVFIGSNMCCQYGFSKELLSKGVKADISLEEEHIDAPQGVDYFLWLPTVNHHAPTPDQLRLGVEALETLDHQKTKVYIHCQRGHGRAPTLYAAYLIKKGMGVEEALRFLRDRRPGIHINEEQMKALHAFQHSLKGSGA